MKRLILPFIFFTLLVSCNQKNYVTSYALFDTNMKNKVISNGLNIKDIQFYAGKNIELRRKITSRVSDYIIGEVKIIDGVRMDVIKIPFLSPGACESYNSGKRHLKISFEVECPLGFAADNEGVYRLLDVNDRNYVQLLETRKTLGIDSNNDMNDTNNMSGAMRVFYGPYVYEVVQGQDACLMIRLQKSK